MRRREIRSLLTSERSSEWNNYRKHNPDWVPDLSGMDLEEVNLVPTGKKPFDLSKANLCGCKLPKVASKLSTRNKIVNLEGATFDVNTTCAPLFDLSTAGAIFVSKAEQSSVADEKPKVFISYAWGNEDVVLAMDAWLRSKGLPTKIDKRDFFAGSRIRDEIVRVMTECNVILIFYSKKSEGKPWPEFERELASDLEIAAKQKGNPPPRIIYVVIDESSLPSISEANRIAVKAKGKRFDLVCEELYHSILQLPKETETVDLSKWSDYVF